MSTAVTAPDKVAYTLASAAVAADVSQKTLQRAIHSGQLRAKKLGRNIRIRHADLEAWLDGLPDA